jgi:hypothetical protein
VFVEIKEHDSNYCKDVAVRGFKFLGKKPKFIPDSKELDLSINTFDKLKENDFKLFQGLTEPKSQEIKACQIICIMLNNMPSTGEFKELKRFKGDSKRFLSKTLVTTM